MRVKLLFLRKEEAKEALVALDGIDMFDMLASESKPLASAPEVRIKFNSQTTAGARHFAEHYRAFRRINNSFRITISTAAPLRAKTPDSNRLRVTCVNYAELGSLLRRRRERESGVQQRIQNPLTHFH